MNEPGMQQVWEWKETELKRVLEEAEHLLWMVQLDEWPDSIRLTYGEARHAWLTVGVDLSIAKAFLIALQYPARVFYECGKEQNGKDRRWRGCRYGVHGPEYISGFGLGRHA